MKSMLVASLIFLIVRMVQAQSYEGFMDNRLPVWVEPGIRSNTPLPGTTS
jgi:hypothetical protein